MADYLPGNASELVSWMQNFIAGLTIHAVELEVDMAEITALSTAKTNLSTAVADQVAKKTAAKTATTVKNTNQDDAESLIRAMVLQISDEPALTDDLRAELGLPIPDHTKTPSTVGPEVPAISLESLPGMVIVHFGTNPTNEARNSKPAWAKGAVVYRKKAGESDYQMVGYERTSPYKDAIYGPGSDYTYFVRYQGKHAGDLGVESPEMTVAARGVLAA